MSLMLELPVDTLAKTLTCSKKSPRPSKTVRRRVLQDSCEQAEAELNNKNKNKNQSQYFELIEDWAYKVPLFWEPSDDIEDSCISVSLVMDNREDDSSPTHDLEEDFEQAVDTYIREKQFSLVSSSSLAVSTAENSASRQSIKKKTNANVVSVKTKRSSSSTSAKSKTKKRVESYEARSEASYQTGQNLKSESWISDDYMYSSVPTSLGMILQDKTTLTRSHNQEYADRFHTTQKYVSDAMTEDFLKITQTELNSETMIQKRRLSSNSDASSGSQKKRTKTLSSRFRGVSKCTKDGRWQARIRIGSVVKYLGRFKDEIEAAHCYDAAAHQYHGARAMPNFGPDGVCLIDKREGENKLLKADDSEDEVDMTDNAKE